jgi:hypothetical protein
MTDDSDIKELLGRALEDEPPMRIDRGEVFRQGRKRLRRRRILEAGSVVAGVVVVAVGAVIFTGSHHDQRGGMPAAASDQPEPATPTMLATPDPSEEPAPPSSGESLDTSGEHATDMTMALIEFLPTRMMMVSMPGSADAEFREADGVYQLSADLLGSAAEGALHIAVAPVKADDQTACVGALAAYDVCELVGTDTGEVAIATEQLNVGEWRYVAFVARQDGTAVTAMVSGLSERQRQAGQLPARDEPVLTRQEFAELARLPGLSYY